MVILWATIAGGGGGGGGGHPNPAARRGWEPQQGLGSLSGDPQVSKVLGHSQLCVPLELI